MDIPDLISQVLVTAEIFFLMLTFVFFAHELGHFLVGRWCGFHVTTLSLGIGPEIIGYDDKQGTRWKICVLPLGSYVKFTHDPADKTSRDPWSLSNARSSKDIIGFDRQSVAKRLMVILAGPIASIVLAIACYAVAAYGTGRNVLIPLIASVQPGGAAERAGMQPGDLIVSLNGHQIETFSDMQSVVSASLGQTLEVTVTRGDETRVLKVTPDVVERTTPFGKQQVGLLGVVAHGAPDGIKHLDYSVVSAIAVGFSDVWLNVNRKFNEISVIFAGSDPPDQVLGPISIAKASGQSGDFGSLTGLLRYAAAASVVLALVNLLPIPVLDGGRLLFCLMEVARGKPLNKRTQDNCLRITLAAAILLALPATWSNLSGLFATFPS